MKMPKQMTFSGYGFIKTVNHRENEEIIEIPKLKCYVCNECFYNNQGLSVLKM